MNKFRIWFNWLWGVPLLLGIVLVAVAPWWWLRALAGFHLVILGEFRIMLNREVWGDVASYMQERPLIEKKETTDVG